MPKVSIILTSFNHEKYLREAIDSALNQTFDDFECIIWDDSSTDNSWDIICSYTDSRIIAHRNSHNLGGGNINRALKIARGEYIAIHHSDDVWELDKLEQQVKLLNEHSDIGAIFTWVQIIDEFGNDTHNNWFNREEKSHEELLRELFCGDNHLAHPSAMIRKSIYDVVGPYKYGLAQIGDAEMWSRILLNSRIFILPKELVKHRLFTDGVNASALNTNKMIRLENEWNVIRLNYFEVAPSLDIFSIFPDLHYLFRNEESEPKFLLAMACLTLCNCRAAWVLGLSVLFGLINDKDSSAKIKKLYNFDSHSFISLNGEYDCYRLKDEFKLKHLQALSLENDQLKMQFYSTNLEIRLLREQVVKLQGAIDANEKYLLDMEKWAAIAKERANIIEQIYKSPIFRILNMFKRLCIFFRM